MSVRGSAIDFLHATKGESAREMKLLANNKWMVSEIKVLWRAKDKLWEMRDTKIWKLKTFTFANVHKKTRKIKANYRSFDIFFFFTFHHISSGTRSGVCTERLTAIFHLYFPYEANHCRARFYINLLLYSCVPTNSEPMYLLFTEFLVWIL